MDQNNNIIALVYYWHIQFSSIPCAYTWLLTHNGENKTTVMVNGMVSLAVEKNRSIRWKRPTENLLNEDQRCRFSWSLKNTQLFHGF